MKLKDLIKDIYQKEIEEHFLLYDVQSISCDSRKVDQGGLFVAIKGARKDGTDYIEEAVAKGAVVVAVDGEQSIDLLNKNICILKVEDTRKFLADATNRIYDFPSKKVQCLGITGTNGKTTISYLIEAILKTARQKCGVIGTINCRYGEHIVPIENTTPSIVDICHYLTDMNENGFSYCAMEVSSHALDQGRVSGIDFKAGIFTNLTQDHLDYHQSMESYFLAKSKMFSSLLLDSFAIVNIDDFWGQKIIERTKAKVVSYGVENKADMMALNIESTLFGSKFILKLGQNETEIETTLIGKHNVYNILAAAATCSCIGVQLEDIRYGVEHLNCVPGRLEPVIAGQDFFVFVDYAHTDDALKNVLTSLRSVTKGKLVVVFGCGGDRDKEKRVKMGSVVSSLADFSIITNDNPRSENPEDIAHKIVSGFDHDRYLIILDRRQAIQKAFSMVEKNDIVLIAGKGHENYQILKNETISFDDRKVVRECLS
ncbi:MAG: UDP-N-acetylmuramoyl-L-alanyl-D-glutamate--2,6-diaminopimelate ligase [Candidatus Omnitrophica bacterium]|nr:UDP-N-acetylmuramoyl-L-alanyl-D-glutamate--2,6-diaminopimelate ligase [Candidatus Omnitrophota bacterium]